MPCQNRKLKRIERDKWYPQVQNLTNELRDLGLDKGHVAKGRMVWGFPSLSIARRNLYHFLENAKPRKINIKALGPWCAILKPWGEDLG